MKTPSELARAIREEAASRKLSLRRRVAALAELHELFTTDRSRVRSLGYLDIPRFRDAYLRYHLPLNAARATCALRELERIRPDFRELRAVVDLGAGPASASLATLCAFQEAAGWTFHLYDRSRAALETGAGLLARVAAGAGAGAASWRVEHVRTRVGRLPALPPLPGRALVWVSMVLNELGVGSRRGPDPAEFLSRLERELREPSIVVVVEPALREPGRSLLRVHDAAAASGAWRILAPCTHQRSCPLLAGRGRSWCHFHFRWEAPDVASEVADRLGLDHEDASLALLVLERAGGSGVPGGGGTSGARTVNRARIIGDPMPVRGAAAGVYACREGKRELLRGVRAGRGDVVALEGEGSRRKVRVEIPWS